ncbi:MAG: leucine-rich repeat protein, partial [Candidatus Cryptobacteroides sp.]
GFCAGDEVGVYMVNYDGDTPGTLMVKDNQADNVRFKFSESGDWVSDYDLFYKDNDTKVDFYGYYPYSDPTSIEAYAHEVEKDQSKEADNGMMAHYEASDFLWTKTAGVTPTEGKVILKFRHIMSSVRVRFAQGEGWTDASEYAAATKEVLVTNTIRKSTIDLSTGLVTPEGEAPLTGIIPLNDNGDFRAIVVPQTVAAGKTLLTISIDGTPRNFVREIDTEYLPGKMTTFDLTVSKKASTGEYEIELSGVCVTAWEADNVSHGDDAREYVVIHNAIPGGLEYTFTERLEMDPTKIKNLKLTGSINRDDYTFMRDKMTSLQRLNLKEVESLINGVYAIPGGAFNGKKTLSKCFLPEKLERIESDAFSNTALTGSLILPEGLKYISGFYGTKITNVHFPSTLEEIGSTAFQECKSLMTEISLPQSLKVIGNSAFSASAISGNLVLPDELESIGDWAFFNCQALKGSLTIPNRVKVISSYAFCNCGFTGTLTLPAGLVEIQGNAFQSTKFKGELNIPSTVTTIG